MQTKIVGRGGYRPGAGRRVLPQNDSGTLTGKIKGLQDDLHEQARLLRRRIRDMQGMAADEGLDCNNLQMARIATLAGDIEAQMLLMSDLRQCLRKLYKIREEGKIDEGLYLSYDVWKGHGIDF